MTFYDVTWKWPWKVNVTLVHQTPITHPTNTLRPKFCLFWLYDEPFQRSMTFYDAWPWNDLERVKSNSGPPESYYTYYIHPVGPNFGYFCSMMSRFRDKWHFMMHDLERVKCNSGPPMTYYPFYIHLRAQILLIYALRQAVSEISDILWWANWNDLERFKYNSGPHQPPITQTTYTLRAQILLIFALGQAVSEIKVECHGTNSFWVVVR